MRIVSKRAGLSALLLALALTAAGCAQADESPTGLQADAPAAVSTPSQAADPTAAPPVRTDREQAFLDELAEFGLPTGMSADTTVEVGIGICRNIAEGAETEMILDHIRPLSSAIATQSAGHDTDEVGRAIVEASRTRLCG
jgi:hypothetical protein